MVRANRPLILPPPRPLGRRTIRALLARPVIHSLTNGIPMAANVPPLITLVTATAGKRPEELRRMLASVRGQTQDNWEVIVVDQSGGALDALLRDYPEVVHVRSARLGLSHNRNIGIRRCSGQIVVFPDDDCVLPSNYIAEVTRFAERLRGKTLFGFADPLQLEDRRPYHFLYTPGSIQRLTSLNCFVIPSWALIYARAAFQRIGGFDEDFGVGAAYGSAEEVDVILRLLDAGIEGIYAESVEIMHPARPKQLVSQSVHRSYSEGLGALARKHWSVSRNWRFLLFFGYSVLRSLGGVVVAAVTRDGMGGVYRTNLRGKLRGFIDYQSALGAPLPTSLTLETQPRTP